MSGIPISGFSQKEARSRLMNNLRQRLDRWTPSPRTDGGLLFSCGAAAVDRLLPCGGLRYGMLLELLGERGSGAATLGLLSGREAAREGGVFLVIDPQHSFYAPAAAAWGIDLDRLVVVRPRNAQDALWAAVQSLRSPAVAAMWAMFDRLSSRDFRRLQLAAQGGGLGILLRPDGARAQPSWADVRLEVKAQRQEKSGRSDLKLSTFNLPRLIQLTTLHCRGGRAGKTARIAIDDVNHTLQEARSTHDSHSLPMVAELADSTRYSHSARA